MVLYFMNVGTLSIMPINKYSPSGIIVVVYTKTITVMTTELSEEPDKMHSQCSFFLPSSEISPSQPSAHWKGERYVSVALLTLIPAGIIYPSAVVDWALAVVVPLHNHW